jgi:excisionase family DNA binding protein
MAVGTADQALLTIEQASQRLGMARSYVYSKFIQTGKIRTIRLGARARRVPATEIERFVREALAEQYGDGSPAA